jgi:predicted XRE-type DNA-binding protein
MVARTKKFKSSDEFFLAAGLSQEEVLIANFRVSMCIEIGKRAQRLELTQEELAARVGTSQANISRILNKNIGKLSTDLILRVLVAVGGKAKIDSTSAIHKRAG